MLSVHKITESLRDVLTEKKKAENEISNICNSVCRSLGEAEQTCTSLRQVFNELQAKLASLENNNKACTKVINCLDHELQRKEEKHRALVTKSQQKNSELELLNNELQNKGEKIHVKYENLKKEHQCTKQSLADQNKAKLVKEEEIKELKQLIIISELELDESRYMIKEFRDQLTEHKCENELCSQVINRLQTKIVQLLNEIEGMEHKNRNIEIYKAEPLLIQDEIGESPEGSNKEMVLRAKISRLKEQNVRLLNSNDFKSCSITILKELLAECRFDKKEAIEEMSKYQDQISESELSVQNNKMEISALKNEISSAEVPAKQLQIDTLRGKLEEAHKKIEVAKVEAESATQSLVKATEEKQLMAEQFDKLQREIVDGKRESEKLQQRVSDLKSKMSSESDLTKAKQTQIEGLQGKLEELKNKIDQAEGETENLKEKVNKLSWEFASECNMSKEQQGIIIDLQAKLKESNERVGQAEDESKFIKDQLEVFKNEDVSKVQEKESLIESLQEQLGNLSSQLETEKNVSKDQQGTIENLQGDLKESNQRIDQAKDESKSIKDQLEALKIELQVKKEDVSKVKEKDSLIESLQEQIMNLSFQLASEKDVSKDQQETIENLQGELDSSIGMIRMIRQDDHETKMAMQIVTEVAEEDQLKQRTGSLKELDPNNNNGAPDSDETDSVLQQFAEGTEEYQSICEPASGSQSISNFFQDIALTMFSLVIFIVATAVAGIYYLDNK